MQIGTLGRSTVLPQNALTKTIAAMHLYVDPTGIDSNDGLSALSPKLTLLAAINAAKDSLLHVAHIHMAAGDYVQVGDVKINKLGVSAAELIIEGAATYAELVAPATSDISSVSTIGLSSLSMTVDQWAGWLVEILTGPAAGQVRDIWGNSATTFTVRKDFTVDPGACSYRVVRPGTSISGSAPYTGIYSTVSGGTVYFNRMHLGPNMYIVASGCGAASFTSTIFNGNAIVVRNCGRCLLGHTYWSSILGASVEYPFVGSLQPTASATLIDGCPDTQVTHSVITKGLKFRACSINGYGIRIGQRFKAPLILERSKFEYSSPTIAGYRTASVDGVTGSGISLENSSMDLGASNISNCTAHGIFLKDSSLSLAGVIGGSGNSGAGVLAQQGSHVRYAVGSPPTITGTVGDLSVDGTTQISTWAAITAGTPVADISEMVTVKAA